MKDSFKKIIFSLVSILLISFVPANISAQTPESVGTSNDDDVIQGIAVPYDIDPERAAILRGDYLNSADQGYQQNSGGSGAASGISTCTASQVLSNMLASGVSSVITTAVGRMSPEKVPTQSPIDFKDAGTYVFGVPVLPPWDDVGYCIVNGIIAQISDSIINWINNGFQYPDGTYGPSYVGDPSQFFSDIADREASIFINELSTIASAPYDKIIIREVLFRHLENFDNRYNYNLNSYVDPYSYWSGNSFSWDAWNNQFTNPNNNPYGRYLASQLELERRIAEQQRLAEQELDYGQGFIGIKNPATGESVVPAAIARDSLAKTLGNTQERLILADEFGEIVDALIQQLLVKVLTGVDGLLGYESMYY